MGCGSEHVSKIGLVVYKGADILSLWDIITFIIVTVPSSLLIKASDHKGCAVILAGVSWQRLGDGGSVPRQQQMTAAARRQSPSRHETL